MNAETSDHVLRRWLAGLGLVLAALGAAVAAISLSSVAQQHDAQEAVQRATDVELAIERFVSSTARLEASSRGYALAGDEARLVRYEEYSRDMTRDVFALIALVRDDPAQLARAQAMRPLVEKLIGLNSSVIAAKRSGVGDIPALLTQSADVTRELAELTDLTLAEQARQIGGRETRRDELERSALYRLLLGLAGTAALIALALWLARRAQRALRVANAQLEARVKARTLELAQAAESISARELSRRFLADAMPQIVWSLTADGKGESFNRRWTEHTGLPAELSLDDGWGRVVHPEDMPPMRAAWYGMSAAEGEYRLLGHDGNWRWHLWKAHPEIDPHGRLVRWIGISTDIHDQKLTAASLERLVAERTAALAQSEERFRLMVARVRDHAIFMLDAEGRVATWNDGAAALKGYTAAEAIGLDFRRFYPEEALTTGLPDALLTAARETGHVDDEGWRVRKDGTQFWAAVSINAVHDAAGTLVGFAKVTRNITARREIEAQLRRSRREFEELFEQASDALIVADPSGRIRRINSRAEKMFGYTRADFLQLEIEALVPSAQRGGHSANRARFHESPQVRVMGSGLPLTAVRSDGTEFPADIMLSPLETESGSAVLATVRDITDRRRAEEAVRQSRERLVSIFETVAEGLVFQNANGDIVECNPAAERIVGVPRGQLVGRSTLDRGWRAFDEAGQLMPIESHPAVRTLRSGEACREVPMEIERPDGQRRWLLVSSEALRTADGAVRGVVVSFADITARKQAEAVRREAEQRLREVNLQLEQKSRELREFAHNASHDLKEPLRAVQYFAAMLAERMAPAVDAETQAFLAQIAAANARMQALVRSLLSYAELDMAAHRPTTVDLSETIELVRYDLQVSLLERAGRIEYPRPLPRVHGDATQLRQLFQNLVSNALKFRHPQRDPVVTITWEPAGDRVRLTVADNGIGFETRFAEKIFEPFERLHSREVYEGSGLGLAICRRVVLRHGGSMTAEGLAGEGARFHFTLPVAQSTKTA